MDQGTTNAVKNNGEKITMKWVYLIIVYCGLAYSINLNGQILLFPSTTEFVSQQDYKEAIHSLLLWYGSNLSGIKQDRDSAITMFSQQADRNNRYSSYYLYQVLSSSETKLIMAPGVDRDSLALVYLKKAAALGYHTAEYKLGTHYLYKENNTDSAYYWICKAIDDSEREMKTSKKKYKQTMFDEWCTLYLATSFKGICTLIGKNNDEAETECKLALKKMEFIAKRAFHPNSTFDRGERQYIAKAYGRVALNLICYYNAVNKFKDADKIWEAYGTVCIDNRIDNELPPYLSAIDVYDNEIRRTCYRGIVVNLFLGHSLGNHLLQYAAERGDTVAKYNLGGKWIEDFARQGDRRAIFQLGGKWVEGLALKGDYQAKVTLIHKSLRENGIAAADEWWQRTMQKSDIDTLVKRCYYRYIPTRYMDSVDTLFSRYVMEKAIGAGCLKAKEYLGMSYYNNRDYKKAFILLEEACKDECSIEAIAKLGHCYRWGYGTNKAVEKAIACYEKALQMKNQNEHDAALELYLAYSYDDNKEYSKAFALFQKLSKLYKLAEYEVGRYYYEGYAGIPDYRKAYACMKKMEGTHYVENSRVQYYLGMCYLKGHAVSKDEKTGFDYLKRAVESKWVYPKVYWEIAKCYRFGRGIERDLKKAEYYEQEAEKAGNDDALWMKEQQDLINVF